jgi:gliding motility-associated-like protein
MRLSKRYNILIISILTIIFSNNLKAQYIFNPSFEGFASANIPPNGWTVCNAQHKPDTQPSFFNVLQKASEGNTFISLTTAPKMGKIPVINESIQTKLDKPLLQNTRYQLKIDLSMPENFEQEIAGKLTCFCQPIVIKIWGADKSCKKRELFWQSPKINHQNWQTYLALFQPELTNYDFLLIEAGFADKETYFGSILVDNLILNEVNTNLQDNYQVKIPNVFTPNGDGKNDKFVFELPANLLQFEFSVYNRYGVKVFETKKPNEYWDGKNYPEGNYYWEIALVGGTSEKSVISYQKGSVLLIK